jgi:hypothetical protein
MLYIVYNFVLMKNDTIVSVIICYDFYHNDFRMLLFLFFNDNVLFKVGRIQDFKLGWGALKKIARKCLGYFVWKITILRKKIIFFPLLGGAGAWIRPCKVRVWVMLILI